MADDEHKPDAGENAGPKRTGAPPFVKGKSGNPSGMRKGTKHRKTLLLAAMTDDDRAFVVRKIISQARRGCRASQRLIVDRLEPPRKGSPVKFPLPEIKTVADVVTALASIATAMAKGRLTPTEAMEVSAVVELARRAIETNEMENRLAAIEASMRSDKDDRKF
jgi:hypothetical protein